MRGLRDRGTIDCVTDLNTRIDLGPTLRAWRDRLSPDAVGLPDSTTRRAPGLSRQEIGRLAGVSPDYVTQLEQGRASSPSTQVLQALARALQLSDAERSHLFHLAGQRVPTDGTVPGSLPAAVRRLVDQLDSAPVAVFDAHLSPVAWNSMWAFVNGDPVERPEIERNLAWRQFVGSPTRVVRSHEQESAYEEMLVADLRASSGNYDRDSGIEILVRDLCEISARFRRLWESRRVDVLEGESKTIDHPIVGELRVDCDMLRTRRSDFRVAVYTATAGSDSAHKLDEARDSLAGKLVSNGA
jgi:hypothetical protein